MKHLLIHQYEQNNRSTYDIKGMLNDIATTQRIESPIEVHMLYLEDSVMEELEVVIEKIKFLNDIEVKIITHHINLNGRLLELTEQLNQLVTSIITPETTVYLQLSTGVRSLQHMLAHELSQLNVKELIFFSGNGNSVDKNGYYAISANEYLSDEKIYHHVRDLVLSGNFKSAANLISKNSTSESILTLLAFGYDLFRLNIKKHNGKTDPFDTLHAILAKHSPEKSELQFIQEMKLLRREGQKQFIIYLYDVSNFYFEQNRLIDFSVIYYRLVEEFLLYALGWDVKRKELTVRRNRKFGLALPRKDIGLYLHKYEKELRIEIRKINDRHNITIRRDKPEVLKSLSGEEKIYAQLYFLFKNKNFTNLLDLRNDGVGGHGFEDFTKEKFIEYANGVTPNEFLQPYLQMFNLHPHHSLINLVQKAVLTELDQQLYEGVITT
jgi:hypothetical protein